MAFARLNLGGGALSNATACSSAGAAIGTYMDQQEAELSRLIAANADEGVVVRQVDKVESIRASLNKHRTLMLLRMRQLLSPDQRVKLNKLYEDRQKDRKRDNKQGRQE